MASSDLPAVKVGSIVTGFQLIGKDLSYSIPHAGVTPPSAVQALATGAVVVIVGFLALVPVIGLGSALVALAVIAPRRFAIVAVALVMLPLPATVFGIDPRIALLLLIVFSGGVDILRRRSGVQLPLLLTTGLLASILTVSFITTMDFPAELSRRHDLMQLVLSLVALLVMASLRLPIGALLRSVAVGGTATATIVLVRGEASTAGRLADEALNPNYLGLLLAMSLVALVGMGSRFGQLPRTATDLLRFVSVGIVGVALVLTQSRAGVLAATLGIVALVSANLRPAFRASLVVAIVLAVLTVPGLTDAVTSGVGNRSSQELASNNSARLEAAELAIRYSWAHPFTGVGYGTFADRARADNSLGLYMNTHNDYLRLAAEGGLPALMAFLVLVQPLANASRQSKLLRAGFAVAVAYLVGLLFANTLANPQVSISFWAVLSSAWASRKRAGPMRARPAERMGAPPVVGDRVAR